MEPCTHDEATRHFVQAGTVDIYRERTGEYIVGTNRDTGRYLMILDICNKCGKVLKEEGLTQEVKDG